jgi:uncharacterized protein (TIGR02996 family)
MPLAVSRSEGAEMDVEAALLQTIDDSPNDDTNWLVLADWLDEQGDPRGDLLRLTLALRAKPANSEAEKQEARIQELLASGVRPCAPTRTNSIGMTFALIRPGTFLMGSPASLSGLQVARDRRAKSGR